jgi:hypothetical protein
LKAKKQAEETAARQAKPAKQALASDKPQTLLPGIKG